MRIDALPALEPAAAAPEASAPHAKPAQSGEPLPSGGRTLPPAPVPDAREIAALIDRYLREAGRELAISVDEATGQTVVSIRDPATGELIRQLPSEEALRIARELRSAEGARLVNERA